jgi:ubiquinone/menaquinone biosynthesis C-methylase UbiE
MKSDSDLRPSGYVSRSEEIWYGIAHPFYDLLTWWCFLPLGGETGCRRCFAQWVDPRAGQRILSMCCGTGSTEQAILALESEVEIIGIDLGAGQIARARRKDRSGRVDYRVGNAARTGLPREMFDRVLIALALHEMPRTLRLSVLSEARRLCKQDGRVVAIEHGRPTSRRSRVLRALWWFYWLPGNPEVDTTRDLQRHGVENEMADVGLWIIAQRRTRPDWIEGWVARPLSTKIDSGHLGPSGPVDP